MRAQQPIAKANPPPNLANWKWLVSHIYSILLPLIIGYMLYRPQFYDWANSYFFLTEGKQITSKLVPFFYLRDLFYLVPPTINKFSVGEHLRLGQRVSMLCSVTDGDLPLTLKWYRHDQLLLPEAAASGISITEIGHYESVLRIDNLRPEHNANFTCVAENYAGVAQHSQTLRVKGKFMNKNPNTHHHLFFSPLTNCTEKSPCIMKNYAQFALRTLQLDINLLKDW